MRERYSYTVDRNDVIVGVSDSWLDFARKNDAPNLTRDSVVGRTLWDFVQGPPVRQTYRIVMQSVRAEGRIVDIPFRCDSPDCRRYMTLRMVPGSDGSIEFTGWIEREEERPPQPMMSSDDPASVELVRMCSWCKRIALPDGRWAEVEAAVRALRLMEQTELPGITHGICGDCSALMTSKS